MSWPVEQEKLNDGIYWQKPWTLAEGCTPVSEGCKNCWSAAIVKWVGKDFSKVRFRADKLDVPKIKKPTVFSVWNDLFHPVIKDAEIDAAFEKMVATDRHIYLVLTKRIERATVYFEKFEADCQECGEPNLLAYRPNIFIGTSIENQKRADERIPELLKIPARRFLSVEPLLGFIDLNVPYGQGVGELALESGKIDWVVVGCESGRNRRPCKIEWIESVAGQCKAADVPVFVKQVDIGGEASKNMAEWPESVRYRELPGGSANTNQSKTKG
jgi:protein gp37